MANLGSILISRVGLCKLYLENGGVCDMVIAYDFSNFLIFLGAVVVFATLLLEYWFKWKDWIYTLITILGICVLFFGYACKMIFTWRIL